MLSMGPEFRAQSSEAVRRLLATSTDFGPSTASIWDVEDDQMHLTHPAPPPLPPVHLAAPEDDSCPSLRGVVNPFPPGLAQMPRRQGLNSRLIRQPMRSRSVPPMRVGLSSDTVRMRDSLSRVEQGMPVHKPPGYDRREHRSQYSLQLQHGATIHLQQAPYRNFSPAAVPDARSYSLGAVADSQYCVPLPSRRVPLERRAPGGRRPSNGTLPGCSMEAALSGRAELEATGALGRHGGSFEGTSRRFSVMNDSGRNSVLRRPLAERNPPDMTMQHIARQQSEAQMMQIGAMRLRAPWKRHPERALPPRAIRSIKTLPVLNRLTSQLEEAEKCRRGYAEKAPQRPGVTLASDRNYFPAGMAQRQKRSSRSVVLQNAPSGQRFTVDTTTV